MLVYRYSVRDEEGCAVEGWSGVCPYMCPYKCPYMCPYKCPYMCPYIEGWSGVCVLARCLQRTHSRENTFSRNTFIDVHAG
jgi:hypothetical protein